MKDTHSEQENVSNFQVQFLLFFYHGSEHRIAVTFSTCAAPVREHAEPFLQLLSLVVQLLLRNGLTGAGICQREHPDRKLTRSSYRSLGNQTTITEKSPPSVAVRR